MRRTTTSGFTLTEILIVIGLIVLIIALAVPAFSYITGSRSVDAGENLVAAMLSRARAEAMLNNRVAGVAFFYDSVRDRTGLALVVPTPQRDAVAGEPPGLEQYKGWRERDEAGNVIQYEPGDVVIALVDSNAVNPLITPRKMITKVFVCREGHPANEARPPDQPQWGTQGETSIDTLVGYEYQYLPPGVGAQTINDPDPLGSGTPRDRYLRSGLILFGGDGALLHRKYEIEVPLQTDPDQTHLFRVMGFHQRTAPLDQQAVGMAPTFPIHSQFGVVLYDEENFRTQGWTNADPLNENVALSPAEQNEEGWLDRESLSLLINRYNGTLMRGE